MPLAIFIIVVMGGLALAISRNVAQTTNSAVQSIVSIQAFYAADTGAQWGMNRMFYDTSATLTRAQVDAGCNAVHGQSLSFSTSGLNNCQTQLSCSVSTDPSNTTSYYVISSAAQCGDAAISSQRSVEVSAFMR
ncbi:hypothetical protein [Simiduia aestuariiviva]|nr:hypothetical protein [Simiduia aestuariiviva]